MKINGAIMPILKALSLCKRILIWNFLAGQTDCQIRKQTCCFNYNNKLCERWIIMWLFEVMYLAEVTVLLGYGFYYSHISWSPMHLILYVTSKPLKLQNYKHTCFKDDLMYCLYIQMSMSVISNREQMLIVKILSIRQVFPLFINTWHDRPWKNIRHLVIFLNPGYL